MHSTRSPRPALSKHLPLHPDKCCGCGRTSHRLGPSRAVVYKKNLKWFEKPTDTNGSKKTAKKFGKTITLSSNLSDEPLTTAFFHGDINFEIINVRLIRTTRSNFSCEWKHHLRIHFYSDMITYSQAGSRQRRFISRFVIHNIQNRFRSGLSVQVARLI